MRPLLSGVALTAVLALVAAGCSDANPTPPPLAASSGVATPVPTSTDSASPTPSPSNSTQPSSAAPVSAADRAAGQNAVQVFLGRVNDAAAAKSDVPVKGTWQQSCIWCATVIQPVQMAAFAKNWKLTPARVTEPHITYWKQGIGGQLLYHMTMSVSAMKLVDESGHSQRSSTAVHAAPFSFAAQKVGGTWQVVQGIQGDIKVATS